MTPTEVDGIGDRSFGGSRLAAEVALLLTVVIWGLTVVAAKIGLFAFHPLVFVVARFSIGALVTAVIVLPRNGIPTIQRQDLWGLGIAAFLGITANQIAFMTALSLTSAVNTSLLLGTIALWATLLSVMFMIDRPDARHWLGVATGIVGVCFIVQGGSRGSGPESAIGNAMALLAALAWASYTVLLRPLRDRYSALELSLFMMVLGTAMALPFAISQVSIQRWSDIPLTSWAALFFAAGPGVALTNVLYFNAIKRVGPSRAAIYTYLIPFLGAIFAVLFLSEEITPLQIVGGLVVILAVAASRSDRSASGGLP